MHFSSISNANDLNIYIYIFQPYNSTFLGNEKKLFCPRSSYRINNDSGTRSHKPIPVNEIKWFWGN